MLPEIGSTLLLLFCRFELPFSFKRPHSQKKTTFYQKKAHGFLSQISLFPANTSPIHRRLKNQTFSNQKHHNYLTNSNLCGFSTRFSGIKTGSFKFRNTFFDCSPVKNHIRNRDSNTKIGISGIGIGISDLGFEISTLKKNIFEFKK
jgi:hypothetical protein